MPTTLFGVTLLKKYASKIWARAGTGMARGLVMAFISSTDVGTNLRIPVRVRRTCVVCRVSCVIPPAQSHRPTTVHHRSASTIMYLAVASSNFAEASLSLLAMLIMLFVSFVLYKFFCNLQRERA
jgi:hypothetical protein